MSKFNQPEDRLRFSEFVWFFQTNVLGYDHMPDLHVGICEWIQSCLENEIYKCLLQAYRHSGKSDLLCMYVCWRLYVDADYTCVIVSATNKLASRNARTIRKWLTINPLTEHLVPDRQSDTEWKTNNFSVLRPRASNHASVQSTSISSQMTGFHGQEVLGDDVETSDNVRTDEGRQAIRDGVAELTSIADERWIYVGTPHDEDTIYNEMIDSGYELYRRPVWNPDGLPAWPERHDENWIRQKEKDNTTGRFKSQYLLIATAVYEAQFDWELVHEYDCEIEVSNWDFQETNRGQEPVWYIGGEPIRQIVGYWDPATGLENRDDSVFAVLIKTVNNNVYVHSTRDLSPVSRTTGFDKQCQEVIDDCENYLVRKVWVEKNFSWTLANELKTVARDRKNKRLRIEESQRTRGQNKQEFIAEAIEPLMKTGKLYVHERVAQGKFRRQLESFPNGRQDDFTDAVAGAIYELKKSRTRYDQQGNLVNRAPGSQLQPIEVNQPYGGKYK